MWNINNILSNIFHMGIWWTVFYKDDFFFLKVCFCSFCNLLFIHYYKLHEMDVKNGRIK